MASLDAVYQKIFRAAVHIKSLEPELEAYFKTNPGKLVREPSTSDHTAVFTFQPMGFIPAHFGLIIGDCLQNLRSSLDYLVWELVLAANNQPGGHNMFPICSTAEIFNKALQRDRLLGVHPDAIRQIDALQPYRLGQDFGKAILWVVDQLANINKHRRVLLTELRAGRNTATIVERDGEQWLRPGPGSNPVFNSNARFGPFPVIDGKVNGDIQLTAFLAFGEGAAKGMEVTLSLNKWALYIKDDIMPRFERFFSPTRSSAESAAPQR